MDEICKPMRKKYWSEMTDTEKISELMDELKRTQKVLQKLSDYINKLINHDHKDGKLIVQIEHPDRESYGGFHFRVYEKE